VHLDGVCLGGLACGSGRWEGDRMADAAPDADLQRRSPNGVMGSVRFADDAVCVSGGVIPQTQSRRLIQTSHGKFHAGERAGTNFVEVMRWIAPTAAPSGATIPAAPS
jgi:hypothetical protein